MPSTVIKSYRYKQENELLVITFTSGKIYQYSGVTGTQYDELKNAYSKGTYFNKYIKPFHPFKQMIR